MVAARSAQEVHRHVLSAARAVEEAERNLVTWFGEMLARRLFLELGYSSIYQYAEIELTFSRSKTEKLVKVCRSLRELPELERAVVAGEVSWTKARTVASVATPETEKVWVREARKRGRRDLEHRAKVARARTRATTEPTLPLPLDATPAPAPPPEAPVEVTLRLTPVQFARYQELRARLGGDPAESMLAGLAALDSNAPARNTSTEPPYQVVIRRCDSCERGVTPTLRGDLPVAPEVLRQAACDSRTGGTRNTATIPPSVRRAVLERDGHRCRSAGCGRTRFLEVHHRIPRSRGGTNRPENLITLCSGCHRATHRHGRREDPHPGADAGVATPASRRGG